MGDLEDFCERNGGTLADLDRFIDNIHRADEMGERRFYKKAYNTVSHSSKKKFATFQDAIDWSGRNNGKAFIPSGNGYIEK